MRPRIGTRAGARRTPLAQSKRSRGGTRVPDENDSERGGEFPTAQTPSGDANQASAPIFDPPRRWGRAERNRLLIWAVIGFIFPGLLVFALHLQGKTTDAVFSVRSELPLKVLCAFCVVLATWIVSCMEKRPLSDYGIPPRGIFGLRFWEGCLWGFAMLSAILLGLRVTAHFQIESVALAGR